MSKTKLGGYFGEFFVLAAIFGIIVLMILTITNYVNQRDQVRQLENERDRVIEVADNNSKMVDLQEKISDIKEEIVDQTLKEEQVTKKTTSARVEETKKKIEVVNNTHSYDNNEKDLRIAEIQIDALWNAYYDSTSTKETQNEY